MLSILVSSMREEQGGYTDDSPMWEGNSEEGSKPVRVVTGEVEEGRRRDQEKREDQREVHCSPQNHHNSALRVSTPSRAQPVEIPPSQAKDSYLDGNLEAPAFTSTPTNSFYAALTPTFISPRAPKWYPERGGEQTGPIHLFIQSSYASQDPQENPYLFSPDRWAKEIDGVLKDQGKEEDPYGIWPGNVVSLSMGASIAAGSSRGANRSSSTSEKNKVMGRRSLSNERASNTSREGVGAEGAKRNGKEVLQDQKITCINEVN